MFFLVEEELVVLSENGELPLASQVPHHLVINPLDSEIEVPHE